MTDDVDFSGTVEEVKDQIRELEEPDYQSLLEHEKDGKDRKTVKEFIESRIDSADIEVEESEEVEETEDNAEEAVEEELVEQIEEETRGGLLSGVSPELVLTSGLVGGLLLGLMLGLVVDLPGGSSGEISPAQAEEQVSNVIGLQFDDYEITGTPEMRNGMYYVSSNITQEVQDPSGNGTTTQAFQQNFYLTTDGELLFPEQRQFGQTITPIDVDAELERAQEDAGSDNSTDGSN